MNLLSPCLFKHVRDPLITVQRGIAHWECRRCGQDLGAVLGKDAQPDQAKPEPVVWSRAFRKEA
jgi:hypothetical protein